MKQATTPDRDSVEMQNEQAEREMRTKASSRSTDRVPKDIQAVVAEIRERRTAKLCGEAVSRAIPNCICTRPENHGLTNQGHAHSAGPSSADVWIDPDIDTLLQIINSTTQPTASASELSTTLPDERVLQPETKDIAFVESDERPCDSFAATAYDAQECRHCGYYKSDHGRSAPATDVSTEAFPCGHPLYMRSKENKHYCERYPDGLSVVPDNSLAEERLAQLEYTRAERDAASTRVREVMRELADFRETVVKRLEKEATKYERLAVEARDYERESSFGAVSQVLTALADEFASLQPKQDEGET